MCRKLAGSALSGNPPRVAFIILLDLLWSCGVGSILRMTPAAPCFLLNPFPWNVGGPCNVLRQHSLPCYDPVWQKGEYSRWANLITKPTKTMSRLQFSELLLAWKMVVTMSQGMWVASRAECGSQLTASKEMGNSVLQPLGTEFYQQFK